MARHLLPRPENTCSPEDEVRNELIASRQPSIEVTLLSASSLIFAYSCEKLVSGFRNDLFTVGTDPFEKLLLPCLATFFLPLIPSACISPDMLGILASQARHTNTMEVPLAMTMMSVAAVSDVLL